jgi:hypothetical protein
MGVKYDAIAKNGSYTDKNGVEKTKWCKAGIVVETKNGGLAMKIEQLPIPFDGWIQFAVPKAKEDQPQSDLVEMNDDIPF